MKKRKYQLFLLCALVGMSIFFVGHVNAAESQVDSIGNLPVQGSIGKIEDGSAPSPDLANELLDICVLIPKELADTLPQTGATVSNRFITVLGMMLVFVGLICLLNSGDRTKKRHCFRDICYTIFDSELHYQKK